MTHPTRPDRGAWAEAIDPSVKLVVLLGFVFAVVFTPREQIWAFAVFASIAAVVAVAAGVTPRHLAGRLLIEVPFVVFAIAMPIVGTGPRMDVLGISLSVAGLWAAWSILAKGTLGVAAAVVLSSTTSPTDLIVGLERLRVPRTLTAIAGFMIRYLDVVGGELHRLQVARISRGDDPRWIWQARATAVTAGSLFVRTYERGERVHTAMLSRGFDGSLPPAPKGAGDSVHRRTDLVVAGVIVTSAWAVTFLALWGPWT